MIRSAKAMTLSILVLMFLSACSIQKLAVNALADTLAGSGGSSNAFMRDNDPQLVAEALPFTIKLYETLLEQSPEHRDLILSTASLFIMYANAFVWGPAEELPSEEFEAQYQARLRAKALYLRGRDLLFKGMDLKFPGFSQVALQGKLDSYLAQVTTEDLPYLYWLGAGWFGAFSLDNFDVELAISARTAALILARAYELDPEFQDRTLDEFYITFHASAPEGYGGDPARVEYHLNRVLELRGDSSVGPYIAYARSVAIPNQDFALFRDLIQQALAIEVEQYPNQLLLNTINQRKAQWLWDTREERFIEIPE